MLPNFMSAMVDKFSGRLEEAMDWNRLKADGLVERVEMTRRSVEPPVTRSSIYDYLDGTKRPGIDRAAVLARALRVRLEWLVEGKRPIRRDAEIIPARPLHEIDGRMPRREADWDWPAPRKSDEIAAEFREGFRRAEPVFNLLAPIVRATFGNLLARVMHVLKQAGHEVGVADARWRGEVAYLLLDCRVGRVPRPAFNKEPASTDGWLSAIADEMKLWRGAAPPADFEVPAPPG